MKFDEPPADVEWNDWGPPVRVVIERGPVMLFAARSGRGLICASEDMRRLPASARAGSADVHVRDVQRRRAPDVQPRAAQGRCIRPAAPMPGAHSRDGLFLHGEQHFTYHRPVAVGDVLEGRMRTSKPIARQARRGPMEVTYFQTNWTDLDGNRVVDERIVSLFFPN
jgi:hypothetical protein